jgi:hypothetical protein
MYARMNVVVVVWLRTEAPSAGPIAERIKEVIKFTNLIGYDWMRWIIFVTYEAALKE